MTEDEMKEKAIAIVKEAHPESPSVQLDNTVDGAFGGTLFFVKFVEDNGTRLNCVYFKDDRPTLYYRIDEFLRYVAHLRPEPTLQRLSRDFLTLGGIGGAIALILVVTICIIASRGGSIPEPLTHVLTTIIGFYFGSKTTGRGA